MSFEMSESEIESENLSVKSSEKSQQAGSGSSSGSDERGDRQTLTKDQDSSDEISGGFVLFLTVIKINFVTRIKHNVTKSIWGSDTAKPLSHAAVLTFQPEELLGGWSNSNQFKFPNTNTSNHILTSIHVFTMPFATFSLDTYLLKELTCCSGPWLKYSFS